MIKEMDISVPVALHLDHGSYEGCLKCIDAGFSSVMFDGSHYPIEENIEKTTELVKLCHGKGLSIEAEVGSIGGEEDGVVGKDSALRLLQQFRSSQENFRSYFTEVQEFRMI